MLRSEFAQMWYARAEYERKVRARRGLLDVFRSAGCTEGVVTIRLKQNWLLAHCRPPRRHRNV